MAVVSGARASTNIRALYPNPPPLVSSIVVSSPLSLVSETWAPVRDRVYTHTHTRTRNDNATTRARSTFPHWPDISNFLPGHWRRARTRVHDYHASRPSERISSSPIPFITYSLWQCPLYFPFNLFIRCCSRIINDSYEIFTNTFGQRNLERSRGNLFRPSNYLNRALALFRTSV